MQKIELSEKDLKDFKLNIIEMEEQIENLNTSITVVYLWAERVGLKLTKKCKIIKYSDFSD